MSEDKTPAEKFPPSESTGTTAHPIERIRRYIEDIRREMTYVSWPTLKQVRSTTLVVLFFTFAMAVFITVIDGIAKFLYHLIGGR